MTFWAGWILCGWIAGIVLPPVIWFASRRLQSKPLSALDDWPKVSVIVPAKDEQDAIGNAIRSLLRLNYPNFEVIAINDRSCDNTGKILDQIAADDSRCVAIHITELPEGWLGKNHAMHQASLMATGDLLLFCDGDVVHEPDSLTCAVAHLRLNQLQHLCLLPRMLPGSLLENSLVAFFGLAACAGQQVHLIQTKLPLAYAGVGAFNLIEAPFYQSFGGHTPIAMDVLDDMRLGKLVKRHGGRQDFLAATNQLSLRWYHSTWGVIQGLEKNGYASMDYSLKRAITFVILFVVSSVVPPVLALSVTWPDSSGYIATCAVWVIAYINAARTLKARLLVVPLLPVAALLVNFAFWRSAWITTRQGGVRWRDSFYPLQQLKDGLYR